jgi:immunity protein 26 of polymorphic toxin system
MKESGVAGRVKYQEGDCFAVPLRSDGFALGVLARSNTEGVCLGYFFGPKRAAVPTIAEVQGLRPEAATVIRKFGHLGLRDGRWPIIGRLPGWTRSSWPMPAMIRYEELTGRTLRVHYDPDDPNRVLSEEVVLTGVAEQGPKDGLAGAGFMEIVLTSLLDPPSS